MAIYHTRDGAVYMSTSGTGTAVLLTKMTEWTLDMPTDRIDVTNFDSTNKEWLQGWGDRRGTLAGFWNDADDTLFTGAASGDGVKLYLYPTRRAMSKYFYGPAWVDASVRANVAEAGRVSATFAANGVWGRQ